jgi:DNA-binding NarL/FixJ family response regulator
MRPRVLLVDDHVIVRKGLRRLLEGPTREVCGEAGNGEEALKKVLELKPDVVVLDISMPIMNGLEAGRRIKALSPKIKIVVLTGCDAYQKVNVMDPIDFDAFVLKSDVVATLHETINALLLRKDPLVVDAD